jgi:hypothetical protein
MHSMCDSDFFFPGKNLCDVTYHLKCLFADDGDLEDISDLEDANNWEDVDGEDVWPKPAVSGRADLKTACTKTASLKMVRPELSSPKPMMAVTPKTAGSRKTVEIETTPKTAGSCKMAIETTPRRAGICKTVDIESTPKTPRLAGMLNGMNINVKKTQDLVF